MSTQHAVTLVTAAIVVLWLFTFIIRIWQPLPAANVLDALMPIVVSGWFTFIAAKGKNGTAA